MPTNVVVFARLVADAASRLCGTQRRYDRCRSARHDPIRSPVSAMVMRNLVLVAVGHLLGQRHQRHEPDPGHFLAEPSEVQAEPVVGLAQHRVAVGAHPRSAAAAWRQRDRCTSPRRPATCRSARTASAGPSAAAARWHRSAPSRRAAPASRRSCQQQLHADEEHRRDHQDRGSGSTANTVDIGLRTRPGSAVSHQDLHSRIRASRSLLPKNSWPLTGPAPRGRARRSTRT